jgi:flavin-binding protein dodecin
MAEKTYKLIELVGTSDSSVAEAIQNAVVKASQSLRGLEWFEVTQVRGRIEDGKVDQFQVQLKVGFRVLDEDDEELDS